MKKISQSISVSAVFSKLLAGTVLAPAFGFAVCLALEISLSGCGAKSHQVKNQPPVINFSEKPYSVEYGTFNVKSISLFYWPEESEDQIEVAARNIKTSADTIDGYLTKQAQFTVLVSGFVKLQCLQTFALQTQDQLGSPIPWVIQWKPLPEIVAVAPVPEDDPQYQNYQDYLKALASQKLLADCQDNQAKRMPLFKWLATEGAAQAMAAKAAIADAVDPVKPAVNMLSATADGSTITITATPQGPQVDVTIQDFIMKGYSPSTKPSSVMPAAIAGAAFIPDRRLLVFGVADASTGGKRHFEVALERGPDFLGMARFSGQFSLVDSNKQVLRIGSISITAAIAPN